MNVSRVIAVLLVMVALTTVTASAVTIEITSPDDGDWCMNERNELYISGFVQNIQENSTVIAFFKAEWDDSDASWYPGIPVFLVPLTEDGNWSCYFSMEPEEVTGPWIEIRGIVLDGGITIESDKGYSENEINEFANASHQVTCKRCTEPTIEIISPFDGENVGYNNINIHIEGDHNLFDPEVTLWLAGYTENNLNIWPLGDCQKHADGSFSGVAHAGDCTVTCNATDVTIYVFALRPPGVAVWEETNHMTPEEFTEFLKVYSCVDSSVMVYRPCTEPTPVPALSPIGMIALIGMIAVIGTVWIKRR